ncbi:MAG: hypothetical protein OEO79_16400 [Gemmatimonadota bacterium]|nr:hypothetical protein [Gemmatimonadota bacterium]
MFRYSRHARLLVLFTVMALYGCGGGDPTNPDPPTISISIDPSAGTTDPGGSLVVTGTATIGGSFSGTTTFAITGLPAGVTISVGTIQQSGNTFTAPITVSVGAAVAPGVYSGTVTASGSGVSDTAAYSLTVTTAPGFTLGSILAVTLEQGASASRDVDIQRTGGFSADVTIAVEGAPTGLTVTPNPVTTAGAVSALTIDAGGSLAAGTYSLTIRGTSAGEPDATTGLSVTVTAAPGGTQFNVDFSVCPTDQRPVWLALKDGSGPWATETGVNDVYTFTINSSTVGVTSVTLFSSDTDVSVDYFATAELAVLAQDPCDSAGKAITGTTVGQVGLTNLTLGGAFTVQPFDGIFGITEVPAGAVDLIGYSDNAGAGSDRMLILRDQDITDGGDIGTIDFTTNGFDPISATMTVTGLVGGELGAVGMSYATTSAGAACAVAPLHSEPLTASFTGWSAPALNQASGEFHVAGVAIVSGDMQKSVLQSFQTMADQSVALPADVPTPTLSDVTGGTSYLRLMADYTLPVEYNGVTYFDYSFGSWNMTVGATAAVQSGGISFAMPDFSGLSGWDNNWGIPANSTGVDYAIFATGDALQTAVCVNGGRSVSGSVGGSYN